MSENMPSAEMHLYDFGTGMSDPQAFACSDGVDRVLKFTGLSAPSVLAQDWIGCILAVQLGISIPEPALVNVDQDAIKELPLRLRDRATSGTALGSRYIRNATLVLDLQAIVNCENHVELLSRLVVLDSWLGTADRMQPDFGRNLLIDRTDGNRHILKVIDFGLTFPGAVIPILGMRPSVEAVVHDDVVWLLDRLFVNETLDSIEALSEADLREIVASTPDSWLDASGRGRIVEFLMNRRPLLRAAIQAKMEAGT